ncbi:MAG: hypothetical protein AB7J28_00950 [Hyphomonadaceae bacterium]
MGHPLPSPPLWRLAFIALSVPTLMGLALGDADWLQAAFESPAAMAADPLDALFAIAAPALILWAGVRASNWFSGFPVLSMIAVAAIAGALVWPFVDARDLVDAVHDQYRSIRRIGWLFWRDRPDSIVEGALLGAFVSMAYWALARFLPSGGLTTAREPSI